MSIDGLEQLGGGRRVLLSVATPIEARAMCSGLEVRGVDGAVMWRPVAVAQGVDLLVTGVGKAAAAGAVGASLAGGRYGLVVSVGIAGSLADGVALGSVVISSRSELVDEGVQTSEEFVALDRMGFGPAADGTCGVTSDPAVRAALEVGDVTTGPVATVSTCSGTEWLARRYEGRGFIAEAMEGAAVGLVAQRLGAAFAEVRAISNTTGDRASQRWDIGGALAALSGYWGRVALRR